MDPPGTLVLLSALICFILAMQWGGQDKLWSNSNVIGCLVGFGLLIIAFVLIEMYQGERAMMVPRLVKKPHLLVGMIYVFFVDAGFFIPLYYIPIYFQVVFGVSASESGIRSLPFMIAGSLCGIIAGIVISVTGRFVPVMYVGSIFATVGCALIFTFAVDTTSAAWIGYQILAGIGSGLSYQVPVIAAQALVDAADLSSITAMVVCMS